MRNVHERKKRRSRSRGLRSEREVERDGNKERMSVRQRQRHKEDKERPKQEYDNKQLDQRITETTGNHVCSMFESEDTFFLFSASYSLLTMSLQVLQSFSSALRSCLCAFGTKIRVCSFIRQRLDDQ